MKKIIFVRHAKSSWEYDVPDSERPLKSRGVTDIFNISNKFKMSNIHIDAVYSSHAKRAADTCDIFVENLGISTKIVQISDKLYDFSGDNVVSFIKSLDDSLQTVAIFGHNYALTSIVNTYGDKYIDNVPTSGLVMIDFNIDHWKNLSKGQTVLVLIPKDLRT
ncbi:histidine phosphatase family protein [Yeosuana sp. MJ-SS3]|uniref:Histidine phosphatase family protein n=1 Tax=Gilvirhabdus luticola TaxID=3079858 RepID=A0ABU3UA60_9FLAO|nr:histidine phosphatase family protein [Yeosuana sp. MJ-SS3]MDU8886965.1 histidine phosphatase family protein [Yeosuana sp. MJ-SS3]